MSTSLAPVRQILTKLSRLSGLNLAYFFTSGAWVSLRYGLISFSGLILSIGFARLGSKELLGQYQAVLAVLALVSVFSLPGLNMAAFKALIDGQAGALIKAVRYSFLASLLGVPVILGYAAWTALAAGHESVAIALLLGGLFFPFFYAPNTWYVFYEAQSSFFSVTWRVLLANLICMVGILGALYLEKGLLVIILLYFSINTLMNGAFFLEVRKKIQEAKQAQNSRLDLGYGSRVTAQKFTLSLGENLPILVVAAWFGYELLAVFQIANFFLVALAGFIGGLSATYLPLLFRYQQFNHQKILLQNLVIGLFLFVLFRLFLEVFFLFIYGEEYRASFDMARNLSYLALLFPLKTYLTHFFTAKGENGIIIAAFLAANACSLLVFYSTKHSGFSASVLWYMYTLSLVLIIPLTAIYLFKASRKTPSI